MRLLRTHLHFLELPKPSLLWGRSSACNPTLVSTPKYERGERERESFLDGYSIAAHYLRLFVKYHLRSLRVSDTLGFSKHIPFCRWFWLWDLYSKEDISKFAAILLQLQLLNFTWSWHILVHTVINLPSIA